MRTPAEGAVAHGEVTGLYEAARRYLGYTDQLHLGPVRRIDFQRFAIAIGDLNPVYFDERAARARGHPSLVAPPLYITSVMGWRSGPPEDELRQDGLSDTDAFLAPVEGLRLVGGGQQLEFHSPVLEGADITMTRELSDIQLRSGRSGSLILLIVRRKYVDGNGEPLVTCTETFIGRAGSQ